MSISKGFWKTFVSGATPVELETDTDKLTRFPPAPPAEPVRAKAPAEAPVARPRRVEPAKTTLTRFETPTRRPEPKPVRQQVRQQAEARTPTPAELGQTLASLTNEPSDDIPLAVLRAALPSRFISAQQLSKSDDFEFVNSM